MITRIRNRIGVSALGGFALVATVAWDSQQAPVPATSLGSFRSPPAVTGGHWSDAAPAGIGQPEDGLTRPAADSVPIGAAGGALAGASATAPGAADPSLMAAFQQARRRVQELTEAERSLPPNAGVRLFAANPVQDLTARFLDGATCLRPGDPQQEWTATIRARGSEGVPAQVAASDPCRVEFPGRTMTEWLVNREEGIEHGFTVTTRPPDAGDELRIEMRLEGVVAVADTSGSALLYAPDGKPVLQYGALKVWDATGRDLAASIEAAGTELAITVQDAGASYPLTIDPLITTLSQALRLEGRHHMLTNRPPLAMSDDWAFLGDPSADRLSGDDCGMVFIFQRTAAGWLFHSWLTSESAQPKDYFGVAVACTETRLVVGAYGTDGPGTLTDRGGAEVYALQGQRWLREATLVAPVSESSDYQGLAVSINGDTIVVGSAYHQPEVFIRSGGVWVHQQTLTALSSAEGVSVQGNTVMVLGYTDPDLAQGPVVYVRTAGVWSEQARLQPSDWTTNWAYKRDVALWGDLAIVSVPSTYDYPAHIWFFRRNGTTWIEQQRIDGTGSDFGYRICLRGDLALFSAHDRPRLLKYNGSQWLELPNPIPAAEQPALGYHGSVAISASRAIIGAGDDHPAWVLHWNGTAWDYETSFDLPDSVTANHAGFSAAVSGSLAILGAPGQVGAGGGDVGAAYVFAREGNDWHYSATLASPAPDTRSRFGHSVALDGTTALIGAPLAQERSGSEIGAVHVYVSAAGVWSKQASLSEPAPAGGDRFGSAVALAGDLAVIGTPGRDQGAMGDAGGAAVFVRSGTAWDHAAALTGQAHAAGDAFGSSVATDGTSIAVGSPLDDTAQGGDAGSACVFVKSGKAWVLQAQLFASDAAAGDRFGNAVAIDGTTALTGAPGADIAANADAGAAYAFTRPFAAWSQQAKLLASQPAAQDAFGSAVALVGDRALVGAPGRDPSSQTDAGAAFAFSRRNAVWAAASTLAVPGALAGDRFGSAVALDAAVAVVGGPGRDSFHGPDAGAAQVYHLSGSAWTAAELLHAPDFFLELPDDYLRPTITLDLDRDTAVIGMPRGHTAPSGRTGTVYVFTQRAGVWLWDASLRPDDQVPVSEFGGCLGIAGSWLFASGSQNPGAGAVFLFRNSGGNWTQHSILKNPDRPDSGGFGQAVDIDGERCAISDSSHNTVHVFQLAGNAWTVLDSVDGPAELSTFGNSLALDGDSLLVGEDWVSSSDHNGSVFCYRFAAGMWRQEALLTLEEPPADARFGSAIAADGGTALISAPYLETSAGIRAGIVEAHVRQPDGTWARQARWTGTQERGEFGHVLALQGDTAVVGSSPKGTWGVWQGSPGIHIYSRGGTQWQHRAFLPAPVEATPSSLGDALALDGETLLASSTRADLELPQFGTLAVDNGAVFAYRLQFVEADVAVHDGPNVSSPEILCGQTSPITFELTLVSKDVERTFTIANTGEEDLHLTGMAVPAGFELLDALPAALAPGANAQFGIRALADSLGVFAGEVTITCDDPEENPFRFPIRSEVVTSAFLQYHQWATAAGLEGADYPPLASPAGDGITNLMKYASNVAPRDPGPDYLPPKPLPGDRGMPRITVVGSGPYSLRFEYLRRLGSDLSYEPLKSSWGTTPAWGPVGGVMTIHPHGTGWERVVIEEPCGTAPRMFGTVRVRLP